ncbi:hypothetical protein BRARA_I04491 [Brassica rapa]|uniref:Uncharacterized protein n=1 Tax=Brassica campestris TaxID=3711 RepID=A0A397Y804_BRACM|nr:hypothetical protein BRARA_I04491 [Brassica rapa]
MSETATISTPLALAMVFAPSSIVGSFSSARTGRILCLASCNKCSKSSSVVSLWFLFINIVATPVFPRRPVRPILCT